MSSGRDRSVAVAEQVLGVRKAGSGQQFHIQWRGQHGATWEAAARMRRQYPQLIAAWEDHQQQQSEEGAADTDESMGEQEAPDSAPDSAALQRQVAELALLVKQQAQRADDQQRQARQQEELIKQLRASPAHSPQPSAPASPQRNAGASAAAAQPRRKEPRLSDLAEYNGASGDKLDAWLAELRRCARYYSLSGGEAVEFAAARLRDAADLWWTTLDSKAQAAISSVDTLATALRGRFQPVTTARKAREQLHSLRQGSRHIDEYIAEFAKLHAQVPDMAEPDARAQFVRGLQQDLANKLEELDWESMPLQTLVARAARIGARTAMAGRKPSLNQMDVDDDAAAQPPKEMWQALLNAMASRDTSGLGAKTQTHHGYTQQRDSQRGGRGGARGGGRGGFRRGPPEVPGVPEQVVRQRMDAQQCVRCGQEGHRSTGCPNAISARGN
jgi:hypothetical protein